VALERVFHKVSTGEKENGKWNENSAAKPSTRWRLTWWQTGSGLVIGYNQTAHATHIFPVHVPARSADASSAPVGGESAAPTDGLLVGYSELVWWSEFT